MIDISPIQILIVLAIALLVFGPKRLPEMGRNIGRGLREFKSSVADFSFDEPSPSGGRPAERPPAAVAELEADAEAAAAQPVPEEPTGTDPDEDLDGIVVPGDPPPR
jgi:sec-independent protein translocase protein TatA